MTRTVLALLGALCLPAAAEPTGRFIVGGACPAPGGAVVRSCAALNAAVVKGSYAAVRRRYPHARYIEPETTMHATSVPNDTRYPEQWGMGDAYGIRLPAARARSKGAGVVVAIVDTGIRRGPDLAGTKILPGYDVVNNDADPTDDNGHGTHVAGTVAQTTDNRAGCAGVAPDATLLPIKVLSASGGGSNFTVSAGIRRAVDAGAHVINLSLGGASSRTLLDAVRYAVGKGVVVVAAAGNNGGTTLSYPAAYPEVIAVAAHGKTGARASFSQSGPNLALSAPGVGILQETWSRSAGRFVTASWNGTSMAAPFVAGVCALLKAVNPALTPADARGILTRTARRLTGTRSGAGALDADAALAALDAPVIGPGLDPDPEPTPGLTPAAAAVLLLVNAEREKVGVPALVPHPALGAAADGHAKDMAARGYFSHVSPEGEGPAGRLARAGYPGPTWGENIAAGQPTPEAVMAAWMASPGHRANLLNPAFRELGVGAVFAPGSRYGTYWVQTFGAR